MAAPVHEHLFGDDRPFAQCHASSVAALGDGRLVAVWFGGSREKHPDVGIWGAVRDAGGWSPPRLVAKVRDSAHWNPVLFAPWGERLHLFFKVGDTIPPWETWYSTSVDGEHWEPPRELVPGDRGGRGPVKNPPIVLANGDWLAPASHEEAGEGGWQAFVDRSSDGGRTWRASRHVPADPAVVGPGCIQPTLWCSRPGHVHMLCRSAVGRLCRSDSRDNGHTWSPLTPTDVPNNNSGACVAQRADGSLVLACNPVAEDWGPRTPLSLAVSQDDGDTWRRTLDIETGEGEYSYPTIIALDDGRVAVTYTWRRRRVAFWCGDPER